MIFGDITNTKDMEKVYPDPIMKVINCLKNTDFNSMEPGKYEIDGKDIYYMVIDTNTKEKSLTRPEIHREFVDVQFLIKGEELIGFARDTSNNKVSEDLLDDKDILFYEDMESENDLIMKPGSFVIFFPHDVHRPACAVNKECCIRKIVAKINTKLL